MATIGDGLDLAVVGQELPDDSTKISTVGHHKNGTVIDEGIISNICELALLQLIEQFEDSTNLKNLICELLKRLQDQEYVLNDLKVLTGINFATGTQLDTIGYIVGLPRGDVSVSNDDEYRNLILTQISINQSSTTPISVINAVKLVTGSDNVQYNEYYPAGILIYVNGALLTAEVVSRIKKTVAGGVQIDLTFLDSIAEPFTFASESGIPVNGLGFNEKNYTESGNEVGGQIVEKYTN